MQKYTRRLLKKVLILKFFLNAQKRLAASETRFNYLLEQGIIEIGEFTYGSPNVYAWDLKTKLVIGKYCSIAQGVNFLLGGQHRTDWVSTFPFNEFAKDWPTAQKVLGHPATKGDIRVGHDVWIGQNATILSGVNIGHGAVIGAGAIVSKDVEPYSIVAGNPDKFIRYRFEEEVRNKLLAEEWWNWDKQTIVDNLKELMSQPEDLFKKLND